MSKTERLLSKNFFGILFFCVYRHEWLPEAEDSFWVKPWILMTKFGGFPDFFKISPTLKSSKKNLLNRFQNVWMFWKATYLIRSFLQSLRYRARIWYPPMPISGENFAKIAFTALHLVPVVLPRGVEFQMHRNERFSAMQFWPLDLVAGSHTE